MAPSAHAFFCVCLAQVCPGRPIVLVTGGLKRQELVLQDLMTWQTLAGSHPDLKPWTPLYFSDWEVLPHETKLPHPDALADRIGTLLQLRSRNPGRGPSPVVVASVASLMQPTFAPGELQHRVLTLKRGDRIEPEELAAHLEASGYEPEAQVTQRGEFSRRGGILDVFALTSPWPARIEFFGDELESIREFDPGNQRSKEEIQSVVLAPAGELGFFRRAHQSQAADAELPASSPCRTSSLLSHLDPSTIVILADPEDVQAHASLYAEQIPAGHPLHIPWEHFLAEAGRLGMPRILLGESVEQTSHDTNDPGSAPGPNAPQPWSLPSLEHLRPSMDRATDAVIAEIQRRAFFLEMHRWRRRGMDVFVQCNNEGEEQRFQEIWKEYGLEEAPGGGSRSGVGALATALGPLSGGFLAEWAGFALVTDAEIFGRYKVPRPRRLKSSHASAARSLLEMDFAAFEPGDYVVHLEHGIGRFLEIGGMPGRGTDRGEECLVLEYAPSEPGQPHVKLYVPVTEAHLVSKYVGAGKARPPLHTLGGTRWAKAKEKAGHAVRDLAADLLSIQAARQSQQGHAFESDTGWQREFESAFLYEETPDQAVAIAQAKKDMEAPKPMDRLVCGDVGFGKTEVAIRAAFKAVMGGKQVALLVPTTVLAQQHYNTFRERMADYPVSIELLSRFRTRKEQANVLRLTAEGRVDILIGTHRIVQPDVVFKDLGLVVIDEEQRFGVMHKEKFKLLRKMVDVLTLTATPIPRTLYLALTGARDLSTIETPPQDRLPVRTIVAPYDESLIREAIQRELNREGQVFFLHNRVTTIDAMAQKLQALVPRARIAVGHGQMESGDLEEVMTRFVNGEADVLLSTTIIESGLDIPNANTILIDRADRFGLSELYQLRGRVGRYKHQAYAYLLIPRHAGLLADARKRINALKHHSSLGSGFKIAMRDLEIRGAGNLLGPQQSGHITAVGFDLYCKLLDHSVRALKGERVAQPVETKLDLDFISMGRAPGIAETAEPVRVSTSAKRPEVHVPREVPVWLENHGDPGEETAASEAPPPSEAGLPADYIPATEHRIEFYRKFAQCLDLQALELVKQELRDRFGKPPKPVELLLMVTEIKVLAARAQVGLVETRNSKLMIQRHKDWIMLNGKFPRLTKQDPAGRLKEIKRLLRAL
ncbi:MAG: transcription-repair coupling factor [Verrucomicrobia bacterium]|nr:transcription-repair coupling factor [Verrucomicrobiota bacterium]